MIKKIHYIKVGVCELSDFELSCIDSWKRVYPDFEIIQWDSDNDFNLIEDCPKALEWFEQGGRGFGFVVDYMRLKVLFNEGGLIMDTDVFANKRIPDSYFETSFLAWANGKDARVTNNGTCHYCEPGDPIVKELIEFYKNDFNGLVKDGMEPSNWIIDLYLRANNGLNPYGKNCSSHDQRIIGESDLTILNFELFGGWDFSNRTWASEDPYLIHCRSLSWIEKADQPFDIFYYIVDENTKLSPVFDALKRFRKGLENMDHNPYFIVFYSGINSKIAEPIVCAFKDLLGMGYNSDFMIMPLGNGLSREDSYKCILDVISKRFKNVKICQDLGVKFRGIKLDKVEDNVKIDYAIGTDFNYEPIEGHKLVVFTEDMTYKNDDALVIKLPEKLEAYEKENITVYTLLTLYGKIDYVHRIN